MPQARKPEVAAFVAARGGSKALPGKNLADFGGKPLIAWTIEAAVGAAAVSRTIMTTDDPRIADVARRYGAEVPFMRPAELAVDEAPVNEAIIHGLEWLAANEGYRPDVVMLLQPTSPFRNAADIDAALALMRERDADGVVSVCPADPHPYWTKTLDQDGFMRDLFPMNDRIVRRQELPPIYALNGAMYATRPDVLFEIRTWYTPRTAAYVMPAERSVDIDTAIDFHLAKALLEASSR